MNNKQWQLIWYGIGSVIAAMVIYSMWQYIIGGLALFGVVYFYSQANNNNRNDRHPRH